MNESTARYESTLPHYEEGDTPQAGAMLRAFFTSSLLSFTSTALVMPFEVGKTLAQVQWVPRDTLAWNSDNEDQEQQSDDEQEAEAFFDDVQQRQSPTNLPPRPISPSGYLLRTGVNDAPLGTKPEWVMPVVVQGGVWDMMRTVAKWKGEGTSSLWKGQSSILYDITVDLTRDCHRATHNVHSRCNRVHFATHSPIRSHPHHLSRLVCTRPTAHTLA